MALSDQLLGYRLPLPLHWLALCGVEALLPWRFLDEDEARSLGEEYAREVAPPNPTPCKRVLPFARRSEADEDDAAGLILQGGALEDRVLFFHLTWTRRPEPAGFPFIMEYGSVWDWLARCVVPDMAEWASRERLHELRGRVRENRGDLAGALVDYGSLAEILARTAAHPDPAVAAHQLASAHTNLARVHEAAGRFEEAVAAYERALALTDLSPIERERIRLALAALPRG
jgi:tetratricopeptide (TPR) repeat protein